MIRYRNISGAASTKWVGLGGVIQPTTGGLASLVQARAAASGRPVYEEAFDLVVNLHRHEWSPSVAYSWWKVPEIYLPSLGFSLCGDVVRVAIRLMNALGVANCRGVSLVGAVQGHTTMILDGVRPGEIWDVDFKTTWLNASGQVATLDDLLADPSIITWGERRPTATWNSAAQTLADIYATVQQPIPPDKIWTVAPSSFQLGWQLPSDATVEFGAGIISIPTSALPEYGVTPPTDIQTTRVTIPAGVAAERVCVPLVLYGAAGDGIVRLGATDYQANDPALAAKLQSLRDPWGVDPRYNPVTVTGPVTLTYLLNPALGLSRLDVDGHEFGAA